MHELFVVSIHGATLIPEHAFELFQCFHYGQYVLFGCTVFLLCFIKFSAEECQRPIVLSNDCTKLELRTVSLHLKLLQVVGIGQDNIFGDCRLHVVAV